MSNAHWINCEKCGKRLIKRYPNGIFHFSFGRVKDETRKLTITVKNADGKGPSKSGSLGVPDIMTVALSPEKIRSGESLVIRIKTSAEADEVFVELEGKKLAMEGSGTDWKYLTQIPGVGTTDYKVLALNKNGEQGQAKAGKITMSQEYIPDEYAVDIKIYGSLEMRCVRKSCKHINIINFLPIPIEDNPKK